MGTLVIKEEKIKKTTHAPPFQFQEGELVNVYENNILSIRNGTYLAFCPKRRAHVILPPNRRKMGTDKVDAIVFLNGFSGKIVRARG